MSQKNEIPILILSLAITAGLIGDGFWWFTKNSGFNLNQTISNKTNNPQTSTGKPSGKTFTSIENVPIGLYNYGGSTSWAPIRLTVDPAITAARPEFRLRYVEPSNALPGSATGIQSLIDGQLAFVQSSRPVLDQELSRAQQRGFSLNQIAVAIDGLAIAVNPNLNIPGLTLD